MKKLIPFIILAAIGASTAFAGTITGTVTDDSNGLPLSNKWVDAYDYTTGQYHSSGNTDSNGFYTINDLAAGTYRVYIWRSSSYATEYYDNVFDSDLAAPVTVTQAETTQNINFILSMGGYVKGRVVDSNGQPIVDMWINVDEYQTGRWRGYAVSDANGNYKTTILPAGTYRIEMTRGNVII